MSRDCRRTFGVRRVCEGLRFFSSGGDQKVSIMLEIATRLSPLASRSAGTTTIMFKPRLCCDEELLLCLSASLSLLPT